MDEFRCVKCKRLLFKGTLFDSRTVVEVVCRCGQLNTYTASPKSPRALEPDGLGGYVWRLDT